MAQLIISAREAFSLGLAFGQYLAAASIDPEATVLDHLMPCLKSLIPSIQGVERTAFVEEQDTPLDIQWTTVFGDNRRLHPGTLFPWPPSGNLTDEEYGEEMRKAYAERPVPETNLAMPPEEALQRWRDKEKRQIGYVENRPNELWYRDDRGCVHMRWDMSRRSLSDQVLQEIAPYVRRTVDNCLDYPPNDDYARSRYLAHKCVQHDPDGTLFDWEEGEEGRAGELASELNRFIPDESRDDVEAIRSFLTVLASDNGYSELFEFGRVFGRVLALAESCHSHFVEATRTFDHGQRSALYSAIASNKHLYELQSACCEFATHPVLDTLYGVREVVEPFTWHSNYYSITQSLHSDVTWFDLNWLHALASRTWYACGRILGMLQDPTENTTAKTVPQMDLLRVRPNSQPDKVAGSIVMAEQILNDPQGRVGPDWFVGSLSHGIEALAKRLWAKEFQDAERDPSLRRGGAVSAVLSGKKRMGTEEEKRFADIALTLYYQYRNPVQHAFDSVRFTWVDARFFVTGMRVLMDAYHRMSHVC